MPTIDKIAGRVIQDSRGQDTIEVSVTTKDGFVGVAAAPAGTSTGSFEALVVPADQAIRTVEELIRPRLAGIPIDDQRAIDSTLIRLDGTPRKERLGGNTLTAVSLAVSRAAAQAAGQPLYRYLAALAGTTPGLPTPLSVLIEGGKHSEARTLTYQEFSVGAPLPVARKMYDALGRILPPNTGLEGGFAPAMTNIEAISAIIQAAEQVGVSLDPEAVFGLDIAASSLDRPPEVSEIVELSKTYPIGLIEDPLPEGAWHLWAQLKLDMNETGKSILIVGDDLFVTNKTRLERGIHKLIANAILIKPNQVGTLTETLEVIALARKVNYTHIVSHRSGETMDDYIADLAVGTGAAYLKAGAPSDNFPERAVKYKRLEEIAAELGKTYQTGSV